VAPTPFKDRLGRILQSQECAFPNLAQALCGFLRGVLFHMILHNNNVDQIRQLSQQNTHYDRFGWVQPTMYEHPTGIGQALAATGAPPAVHGALQHTVPLNPTALRQRTTPRQPPRLQMLFMQMLFMMSSVCSLEEVRAWPRMRSVDISRRRPGRSRALASLSLVRRRTCRIRELFCGDQKEREIGGLVDRSGLSSFSPCPI
jgi:hypothetical protein